jgi:hypothetical protein
MSNVNGAESLIRIVRSVKVIASLEVDQTGEVLERLKREAIPVEIRAVPQASGLEISEIMVEDSYYERGCDVVETWNSEEEAARRKRSRVSTSAKIVATSLQASIALGR